MARGAGNGAMARDGARYRIGPLTTYARPDDMRRWAAQAGDGHRCTYAVGPVLGQDPAVALAQALKAEGTVHLARIREGHGFRYFMEKRPAADVPDTSPSAAAAIAGRPEGRLLEVLSGLADRGEAMPSLEALAELAGLPHRQAASYRLRLLVEQGFVTVREAGERRFVEMGERT